MKMRTEKDILAFVDMICRCEGAVYLITPALAKVNLKNGRELTHGLGLLMGRNGYEMQLITENPADEWRLKYFEFCLNQRENCAHAIA